MVTIRENAKEKGFVYAEPRIGNSFRFALIGILSIVLFFSALAFPLAVLGVFSDVNEDLLQIFSISLTLLSLGAIMRLALGIEQAAERFAELEKERFSIWLEERYGLGFEQFESEALYAKENIIHGVENSHKLYVLRSGKVNDIYYLFYESEVALSPELSFPPVKAATEENKIAEGFEKDEIAAEAILETMLDFKAPRPPKLPTTPPIPKSFPKRKLSTALVRIAPDKSKVLVKIPTVKKARVPRKEKKAFKKKDL